MSAVDRVWAIYAADEELVCVLDAGGGPVFAPGEESEPLLVHAALHGRFVDDLRVDDVLAALRGADVADAVFAALSRAGLAVVATPRSAMRDHV